MSMYGNAKGIFEDLADNYTKTMLKDYKSEDDYTACDVIEFYDVIELMVKVFEATKKACKEEWKYLDIENIKIEDLKL